jgi:hypothetical protein
MGRQICIRGVTGAQLLAALENGVSAYPKMEGRFPCVAGVRFVFDPQRPPGARIDAAVVRVDGQPLDLGRTYRLATKTYLASGRDGYGALVDTQELVSPENCPTLPTLVRTHLTLLNAASAMLVPNPTLRRAVAKLLRPVQDRTNETARRAAASRTTTPTPSDHPAPADHRDEDEGDDDPSEPAVCLLSSDDEEAYPEVAAAARRRASADAEAAAAAPPGARGGRGKLVRRHSIVMDRATRPNKLRVVAVIDGRITMASSPAPTPTPLAPTPVSV